MKRIICMVLVFALIAAPSALAEGHRELENYTRYFDYQPEVNEPLGMIPGTDHSTLVLYFSRVGNTAFPEDVDAVSNADVRRGLAIASDNPQSSQDEVLQYIHSVQK